MQLNLRLLNKTPEEVKIALSNYEKLFMETLEHWDTNLFSKYINQSYQSSISKVASYIFLPQDQNHEEYNKQRSLLYTFPIYNYKTNKYETKDFSSLINKELEIPQKIQQVLMSYQNEISKIQQNKEKAPSNIENIAHEMLIKKIQEIELNLYPRPRKKNILTQIKQRLFCKRE